MTLWNNDNHHFRSTKVTWQLIRKYRYWKFHLFNQRNFNMYLFPALDPTIEEKYSPLFDDSESQHESRGSEILISAP